MGASGTGLVEMDTISMGDDHENKTSVCWGLKGYDLSVFRTGTRVLLRDFALSGGDGKVLKFVDVLQGAWLDGWATDGETFWTEPNGI